MPKDTSATPAPAGFAPGSHSSPSLKAQGFLAVSVKGREQIKEIPKSQRYIGRPSLSELFMKEPSDKKSWEQGIKEAVEKYGHSQKEVADYLGIHYATVSRVVNKVK